MGSALSTAQDFLTPVTGALRPYLSNARGVDARTLLVFSSALMFTYLVFGRGRRRKLPPGPFAFPVVGNMPQFAGISDPYKYMLTLRERHGDIVRLQVGSMTMFVVFGPKLVRELMLVKGHSIVNRPNWIYIIDKIFHGKGVFWGNGESWRCLRKLTVGSLRDFGVGKRSLEERILEEFGILADVIADFNGARFDLKPYLADGISNIMCSIVFGERFDYHDQEFKRLLGYLEYLFNNAGIQVPENFFPWMSFFRKQSPAARMIENDKEIQEFVLKKVEEHRVNFDPSQLRDFIDVFLKAEQEETGTVSLDDMFRVTVDLFLAGSEATSTVMQWMLLYLVTYPDVQRRCWEEITKITGSGRAVGLADKPNLTYIMATLNEVLRHGSIAPMTPPHSVVTPVEVEGYRLETDDILIFHLYSCHMDTQYWENPHEFRPDRWLGKDGQIIKNQALVPFGIGPRTCLGEPLVQMEAFLFSTNLIQRFEFRLPPGVMPPGLVGRQNGITNRPPAFQIEAIPRN